MTPYVKSFIEKNIEEIEYLNYDVVIKAWYDKANTIPGFYEDAFFDEFIYVMSTADSQVFEHTTNIREQLMRKEIHKRIHTLQINYSKGVVFTASSTIVNIVTKLGLTDEELTEFADDTATKLGLEILRSGEYQNT